MRNTNLKRLQDGACFWSFGVEYFFVGFYAFVVQYSDIGTTQLLRVLVRTVPGNQLKTGTRLARNPSNLAKLVLTRIVSLS